MALFISYTKEDLETVRDFSGHLSDNRIAAWFDGDLAYGENWQQAIQSKISQADGFVIFISKHFYSDLNGYIHQELDMAIDVVRKRNYKDWIFFILLDDSPIPRKWINDQVLTSDLHAVRLADAGMLKVVEKLCERFGGSNSNLPSVRLINDSQHEITFALANKSRNQSFRQVKDGKTFWEHEMKSADDLPPPEPEYFEQTYRTIEIKPHSDIVIKTPRNEYFVAATYMDVWMDPDGRSNGYRRKTSNAVSVDLKTCSQAILRCRRSQKSGGFFSSRESQTYLFVPAPILIE